MQFKGKLVNQTWENGKKPNFRPKNFFWKKKRNKMAKTIFWTWFRPAGPKFEPTYIFFQKSGFVSLSMSWSAMSEKNIDSILRKHSDGGTDGKTDGQIDRRMRVIS